MLEKYSHKLKYGLSYIATRITQVLFDVTCTTFTPLEIPLHSDMVICIGRYFTHMAVGGLLLGIQPRLNMRINVNIQGTRVT